MKILVTGCNGFIGRHVVSNLQMNPDISIFGIGSSKDSYLENYISCDISEDSCVDLIKNVLDSCDVIVHIAAKINYDFLDTSIIDVNIKGTNNIVSLAKELACKKIIYFSSLPVIGKPIDVPITEEHKTNPTTLYHISKLAGEHIINLTANIGVVPFSLRIPSPIGISMNEKTILPVFIKSCLENKDIYLHGSGGRRQNYISAKDIARAVSLCLSSNTGGVFNIAGDECVSNFELAKLCKDITKSNSNIIFSGEVDPQENMCWDTSIEKAKRELNFYPDMNITETIKEMADYFEDNMLL